ncbi:MAG: hypothetical protein AMJ79_08650 [Phycisphaerae bacterium SM23_30]|nr:MAG: hypothetical protein AMJ79_08650 [Phycisphaerae bacterium SM23_30]
MKVFRGLWWGATVGLWGVIIGCNGMESKPADEERAGAFFVKEVRLQRSFTRILEADPQQGEPAGIEAYVELLDQFGDPIKGAGVFRFEIFRYVPAVSDPRGRRFAGAGMQVLDLSEPQVSQQYWDGITQCYRMILELPEEAAGARQIVLQATFISDPTGRVQDTLVLERGQ